MTAAVHQFVRRWWRIGQAPPAIYGTIIGASVMAASDEDAPVTEVAAAVLITLIVYWAAERWSIVLGSQLERESFGFRDATRTFAEGWPMVKASYAPLIAMFIAKAAGSDNDNAIAIALDVSVAVLVALGVVAGRRAGLSGWGVAGSAAFTGFLGLTIVLLKAFLAD